MPEISQIHMPLYRMSRQHRPEMNTPRTFSTLIMENVPWY